MGTIGRPYCILGCGGEQIKANEGRYKVLSIPANTKGRKGSQAESQTLCGCTFGGGAGAVSVTSTALRWHPGLVPTAQGAGNSSGGEAARVNPCLGTRKGLWRALNIWSRYPG